jgi:hypothetical protein
LRPPTYSSRIAAILRSKCETCHRPGQIAPFSLQTYGQARAWARDIRTAVENHQMPPWKPVPHYGEFRDAPAMGLTEAQRADLLAWCNRGAPLGDPRRVPPPAHFANDWKLGTPDMVLQPDRGFHVPAEGEDVYRNFALKTNFTEDRYLSAIEVKPGARAVVHHILLYCDPRADSDRFASRWNDGQPGYGGATGINRTSMLGGWAPGNEPPVMPEGTALRIPKGANVVLQIHYHLNGKEAWDRTAIGLHFARSRVTKVIYTPMAVDVVFKIPAGDPHYELAFNSVLGHDYHLIAVSPHMHLLGRDMKVWATLPDGSQRPIIWINDWDLSWQNTYVLKEPMALPAGTKINVLAHFDNSDDNPRNPHRGHLVDVTWGESTLDEMCIAFLGVTKDDEQLDIRPNAPPPSPDLAGGRRAAPGAPDPGAASAAPARSDVVARP